MLQVYAHCFLTVCDVLNSTSRCSLGCQSVINKRDVNGEVVRAPSNAKSYLMSQGPLLLSGKHDIYVGKADSSKFHIKY